MSILIVSDDAEAASSLRSALTRLGQETAWESAVCDAKQRVQNAPPLVLVADNAMQGHDDLIASLHAQAPWTRIYLMADPEHAPATGVAVAIPKPFDAAELAALLTREQELAGLELGRRNLQAHVEELAMLVETSFEAIVGLGGDGTIRSWNPGARVVYGYAPEEILGRHVSVLDVDAGASHERLRAGVRQVLEVLRRRKDGREILVLLSLSPAVSSAASAFGFAEVSLDITERRRLERELEHAERLAAIGRIAAGMAHEINNPLAVIDASTAYLAEMAEGANDPEFGECTRDIALAIERISSFVQHVCGFARRERPQLCDVPLAQAVDIALRMVRPRAGERRVTLRVESALDARVPHDPPRLAQAILNVLSNAVDAAAAGGKTVQLRVREQPGLVHIEVDDDGPGVSPEMAGSLFEPFATTKPPGQGTGLGLAITQQIMADHRGSVSLRSRPEGGTRAELVLPSFDPQAQRILVLDADASVRRALAQDLRRERFDVITADSLASARALLAEHAVRVIVTDARLPDGDGAALVAALATYAPGSRCIVVSGDPDLRELSQAHAFFAKPWDRTRLIAAIRQACL
ncbi:MAG TPA: ATP-binding protein [Polyangiaceae bacterium]